MRMLSIIDGLGTGGAERSLAEIAVGFGERGHLVEVVCLHQRSGAHEDLVAAGVRVHVLTGRSFFSRVREFRRIIAGFEPDVVHSTLYASNLVARFSLIGLPCPLVTSLVNVRYDVQRLELLSMAQRWKYRLARRVDEVSARRLTDHFHAITNVVAEDHLDRYRLDSSAVTVVPRGRDQVRFHPAAPADRAALRSRLGIGDEVIVLSLGRQETQKGHVHLLAAARLLPASGARILIAGREGSESDRLDRSLSDGSGGCPVELLGFRRDVLDLLQAADIFVFPSLWEGLGGALVEAMAAGLPIVASDIPAVAEVVVDGVNADLVPAKDPAALAGALNSLIDDEARRRTYGQESRGRFLAHFEAALINDRLIEMMQTVRGPETTTEVMA